MNIEVAKITEELALNILGILSNDNIRYFNPRQDELGNWIMDLEMAINNNLDYEILIFTPEYFEEVTKIANENLNGSSL